MDPPGSRPARRGTAPAPAPRARVTGRTTQTGARAPGLRERLRLTPCAGVLKSSVRQARQHGRRPFEAMPVVLMPGAVARITMARITMSRITLIRRAVIQDAMTRIKARTGRRIACRTRTRTLSRISPAEASTTPATPESPGRAVFISSPPLMPFF